MDFLFVDRILQSEPGKHILGVKHVTPCDRYLSTNTRGEAVLMPSIIGEALGQLVAWNIMELKDFQVRPVAGVVGEVAVLGDAKIGDSILLESWVDEVDDEALRYHSVATVNGKPVLRLTDAIGPFLPMEMFIAEDEVRRQYAMIDRSGEAPMSQQTINNLHCDIQPSTTICSYDHIIAHQVGEQITAVKNLSLLAPYFIDHFPRKPVLPLSLLLQSNIELARHFFRQYLAIEVARNIQVKQLQKIKIKAFAQPGDTITTQLQLKASSAKQYILQSRTSLDNKIICSVEIICE